MAANKRPTLAESGIEKLFHPPEAPVPAETPSLQPVTSPNTHADKSPSSSASWDATHKRRTFHCPNDTWNRLVAWCDRNGVSHSAAMTQALEAFLNEQGGTR
ncbi:MAG: hypothetical protein C7B43_20795 [Sulfobacillus benefaciens]|uniref:Uncharacterized protein n=1 Tax=Sulfobacillus benefaciens TaxID=453960 RepID=A0A2T2WJH1_9FIRM|nr:MAG: hypothetical protein C7B43_20795 [Sulfobacillus benefaciens]